VAEIRYELRNELPEPGLLDELAAEHPRIGVEGLLRRRGTRAWPGRPSAEAAVDGFRWALADGWSLRWWPQGVEVLSESDDSILVVSWFAQPRREVSQGARVTIVDRRDARRPRYHHVLLVEAVRHSDGGVGMEPVQVHAGGLARIGHVLFVAATFGGLRAFDLRDILQVTGPLSRGTAPFGYRCVLPQSGYQRLHGGRGEERMRLSFVSVERGGSAEEHLVVGEFGPHGHGRRLGRILAADLGSAHATVVSELHEPGIARMQGAAVLDGTWFISASNGVKPGDLWVGADSRWTRHGGVLPAGPEDLASTPEGRRLWSLCEYPRRRWVYALDAERWARASGGSESVAATAR
jgi:hypothetical protein